MYNKCIMSLSSFAYLVYIFFLVNLAFLDSTTLSLKIEKKKNYDDFEEKKNYLLNMRVSVCVC